MAMRTPLSSTEVEVVAKFLEGMVNNPEALKQQLERERSIYIAIVGSGLPQARSLEQRKRLEFVAELDIAAGGHLELVARFWEKQSLRDVAEEYCTLKKDDGIHVRSLRAKLFVTEPTAVLCALVVGDVIAVQPDSLKETVTRVFRWAVSKDFNVSKQPISRILDDPEFRAIVPSNEADRVREFFKSLQRLQALVVSPEDLACLLKSPFTSAYSIANTSRSLFVKSMADMGMLEEPAMRIYDHAITVETRNEQAWAALLQSRTEVSLAPVSSSLKSDSKELALASEQAISYTSLFGEINIASCEDCASVNSPAAYFVDLIRILKNTPSVVGKASPSLLDKLFARRPDLKDLELSCPNTNILIPYIDLANEVMESFIKSIAGSDTPVIKAFNMDNDDTSEDCISQPHNTDYNVYRQQIASQVFPLSTFPYNQALDTMRIYLKALGASRYEMLSLFQSKYQTDNLVGGKKEFSEKVEMVLENAMAAEYFGIEHEDFVAITNTSFFPLEYLQEKDSTMNTDKYVTLIGLLTPGQYWGYSKQGQTAEELMVSERDGKGLPFIHSQLLRRAEISYPELLDILRTRFCGQRLVLETPDGSREFSGRVEELRLRHPTKSPLRVQDCSSLQAFIRLWRKTRWSVFEVDAAITYFATPVDPKISAPQIDAGVIRALATVQQIACLTGMKVSRLLPLWGIVDTNGDSSLYAQMFLHRKPSSDFKVFAMDENGKYLSKGAKFSDHLNAIIAALQLSLEDFKAALASAKITDDAMTLSNVSLIYRISLLSNLLGIPVSQYDNFLLIYSSTSPFKDPQTTLSVISNWKALADAGLGLHQISSIVTGSRDDKNGSGFLPSEEAVFHTASTLVAKLVSIRETYQDYSSDSQAAQAKATAGEVTKISSMIFDPPTASKVATFVETSPSLHPDSDKTFYKEVLSPYFHGQETEVQKIFFGDGEQSPPSPEQRIGRRIFYLKAILPVLRSRLVQEAVLDTTRPVFPALDATVLQKLLGDVIHTGQPAVSGLKALCELEYLGNPQKAPGPDTYFLPPATDVYKLSLSDTEQPQIYINNVLVKFDKFDEDFVSKEISLLNGQSYHFKYDGDIRQVLFVTSRTPKRYFSPEILILQEAVSTTREVLQRTSQAGVVINTFKLDLPEVQYLRSLESTSPLAVDFNQISLLHLQRIQRYCALRDTFQSKQLSPLELFKWASLSDRDRKGALATQLSLLTGWPELQLKDLIKSKYPGLPDKRIVVLFQDDIELTSLKKTLSFISRAGLPGVISPFFQWATPQYPRSWDKDFKNAAELRALVRIRSDAIGVGSIITTTNDHLRTNQRTSLIRYLLQNESIQKRNLLDADNLFEFFLIDVQMGPCLQTSRIKQAISTIQLFVQRCNLGLERDDGIASNTINQDRWQWMQKYRLWEANRKVFLYPENWLDPTLRDDKSEAFKALESSILQDHLTPESIISQIKSFIYATNGISDLDVQTYLWKKDPSHEGNYSGKFHFFARTRTTPYLHYYRKLEYADYARYWSPWTKIDAEVPVQTVDAEGKMLPISGSYLTPVSFRNRLFLFIPQLTSKPAPNQEMLKKSPKCMGGQTVNSNRAGKYWEIQIGWTEYRNGFWTPKQMSQATLNVEGAKDTDFPIKGKTEPAWWANAQRFPDVSSFKFWVRTRRLTGSNTVKILVVEVERWIKSLKTDLEFVNYPLGRFEMRGEQLVLIDMKAVKDDPFTEPGRSTVNNKFSKLQWHLDGEESPATPGIEIDRGKSKKPPLLGVIKPLSKMDVTWAMAFDETYYWSATGFVQDIIHSDNSISYFTYPPLDDPDKETLAAVQLQHGLQPSLMEAATMYDDANEIYKLLSKTSPNYFGLPKNYHELSKPDALYNWELAVHTIMLLMERLLATQQFDLALQVAHFIFDPNFTFDPTADGTELEQCWLFPPFRDPRLRKSGSIEDVLKTLEPSSGAEEDMLPKLLEWRKNPFAAHAFARGRPAVYMKRIVMKYIEILVASGDEYFRQNTLEAIPLAIQRYVEASHVYGASPKPSPNLGKKIYKTYHDLEKSLDDFSNAVFDMELDFPFYSEPATRGRSMNTSRPSLTGIMKTTYFCIPANPQIVNLRNLIDDRLYKIRHCQDINGVTRKLPLFEPPIDPGLLVKAAAGQLNLSVLLSDIEGPMPNYRFIYLLKKAFELCGELKTMGALFLAVREKKDAEELSILRAKQESAIQTLSTDIRQMLKREAEKSIEVLEETRKGQVSRLSYYLTLTGEQSKQIPDMETDWNDIPQNFEPVTTDSLRMTPNESVEYNKAEEAAQLVQKALHMEIVAGGLRALPSISISEQPLGLGVTLGPITANISEGLMVASSVMRMQSQQSTDEGFRASRTAQLIRQLQERRMQANMAGHEIKTTDKQIAATQARLAVIDSETKLQQKQIEQAAAMEEWLQRKYTSKQLYSWIDGSVRNVYYQTYLLASDLAKKAQRAFRFERGADTTDFIEIGYWDSGRDGILAGENLYLGLKRMEAAYHERNNHDFEIVKHISLRQTRPLALLELRETGVAKFSLPEVLFDFDFAGHYCRRIKSVRLSIPCIVGPYTGINATLTLLEHRYRVQGIASGSDYVEKPPGDPRFHTDQIPISSVAVSQGQEDSGSFTLDFRDERYVPFEGAGVISTWRIELPTAVRQFNYHSISDVVINMQYTALGGGSQLRSAASAAVVTFNKTMQEVATDGLFAIFDLKSDYATEWYNFMSQTGDSTMALHALQDQLPFWTKNHTVNANAISLIISAGDTVEWTKSLTLKASSTVPLKSGADVGASKVLVTDKGTNIPVGDWQLTMTAAGKKAQVERILLMIRYTFS